MLDANWTVYRWMTEKLKVTDMIFFSVLYYEIMLHGDPFQKICRTYVRLNLIFTGSNNGILVPPDSRYRLPPIPHLLENTSLFSEVNCAKGITLSSKMVSFEFQKMPKISSHNLVRMKLVIL